MWATNLCLVAIAVIANNKKTQLKENLFLSQVSSLNAKEIQEIPNNKVKTIFVAFISIYDDAWMILFFKLR